MSATNRKPDLGRGAASAISFTQEYPMQCENLELAGQIMRHYGNAGEYGVTVFIPWDWKSPPPESDAECFLIFDGTEYPMPLGELVGMFRTVMRGVKFAEQVRPRWSFKRGGNGPLSRQEEANLLCDLLNHWTVRPLEDRPGAAGLERKSR